MGAYQFFMQAEFGSARSHNFKVHPLFLLQFAISQAGIAVRNLTLMRDSEKKNKRTLRKSNPSARLGRRALITTSQRRRCWGVKLPYLNRVKEEKAVDGKYMDTHCENAARSRDQDVQAKNGQKVEFKPI